MNKAKVMQMIENYGSKQYEAGVNYGYENDMDSEDFKDLEMRIYNIKNEIYSKPVMPKVFDDWYKYYKERAQDTYYLLQDFNEVIIGQTQLFDGEVQIAPDEDVNLYRWMWEGNSFEYSKYLMCVEAIIDGYEVDDDE